MLIAQESAIVLPSPSCSSRAGPAASKDNFTGSGAPRRGGDCVMEFESHLDLKEAVVLLSLTGLVGLEKQLPTENYIEVRGVSALKKSFKVLVSFAGDRGVNIDVKPQELADAGTSYATSRALPLRCQTPV